MTAITKKKKADVWMPLYVSDYLSGTMHLNIEQHGAYMLLLMASWKCGARLPSDPAQLQAITRMTPQKWKSNEPILRAFFHVIPGFWVHDRVKMEIDKAVKNTEARAASGKKGASVRWQPDSKSMANA